MDCRNIVKRWLEYSDMDISSAKYIMGRMPKQPEIVCTYSLQAGEKALKGFLVSQEEDITGIAQLVDFLDRCVELDSEFSFLHDSCKMLTLYYTQAKEHRLEDIDYTIASAIEESQKIQAFVCQKVGV